MSPSRVAIAVFSLVACGAPDPNKTFDEKAKDAVDKTADKVEELGERAAARAEDVAHKTVQDAKVVAQGTADEAQRVAGKTADAADQANAQIEERVGNAGDRLDNAADQVTDIAKDGMPEPASADEVAAALHDLDTAITCESADKCTVTRDFAARLRERPDVLAAQAKIEPVAGTGMRLNNVGDLPKKVGLQYGDVVTAINDVPLKGTEVLPQLVLQLGASRFEIDYTREGTEHTLQIDVV
jgi:uncharacterized protein YjbJ (UPF0337 family)